MANNPVDNIDFASFDDLPTSRPTIPDENYELKLLAKVAKSKKGQQYITYDAVVQTGPEAGSRIFNQGIWYQGKNGFRLKQAAKVLGIEVPGGLTVNEAAAFIADKMNGMDVLAAVGKKPRQTKNDEGVYVDDPEAGFDNVVRAFIKRV